MNCTLKAPVFTPEECAELYAKAHQAGQKAVQALEVVPMVVQDGSVRHFVSDGPCGFAWVVIKPANSKFCKYLASKGIGRKSIYESGFMLWVSDYNQSLQKKETYAYAFADVLRQAGVRVSACSRMD